MTARPAANQRRRSSAELTHSDTTELRAEKPSSEGWDHQSGVRAALGDVLSDEALLAGVRAGDRKSAGALFGRYQAHVSRVIARIVGADSELPDLVHEAFLRVLGSVPRLTDSEGLGGWVTRVATYTAMDCLKRRRRRKWLLFLPPEQLHEGASVSPDEPARAELARLYAALDHLPVDERTAFALRFLCDMELSQVAAACGCSLATVKRRLARAERSFREAAKRDPELSARLARGDRWG